MKFDTSTIDLRALAHQVSDEYGIAVATLTFTPKGEEAYCYIVESEGGERAFLRAQLARHGDNLESVYAITRALHNRGGLHQVLSPLPTRQGALTWRYSDYTVALFPFIAGVSAYEIELPDSGLDDVAALIARLHGTAKELLPPLTREIFQHPFGGPIRRALAIAAEAPSAMTSRQRMGCTLLLQERDDLLATLDMVDAWGRSLRQLGPVSVPTHGDPNLSNVLIDTDGIISLTDWGEVALGPRERDLAFFTGERFAPFLRAYTAVTGAVRLHAPLFTFYSYRWALQEIADYTTRLFSAGTVEEHDYAWGELQPYLPIRHTAIRMSVDETARIIRELANDGIVVLPDTTTECWPDQ